MGRHNLVSEGGLTPGQTLTLKAREISRPANSWLVSLRISFLIIKSRQTPHLQQ
jgi:hypothetical protein